MFRINYSKLLKTTSAFWFDSCSRIIKTRSTTVSPMLPGNSDTAVLMMIPVRSGPSKISHRYTMNTSKDVDQLPNQMNPTLDEVQNYTCNILRDSDCLECCCCARKMRGLLQGFRVTPGFAKTRNHS